MKTLYVACQRGLMPLLEAIVEHRRQYQYKRSYLRYEDELGRTPLFVACQNGHVQVAEYLIDTEEAKEVRSESIVCCLFLADVWPSGSFTYTY